MPRDDLILITGASGGIGLVLTELLLKSGWRNLVCQYRTRRDCIARLLEQHGLDPEQRTVCADLVEEQQAAAMHQKIQGAFGPVYGLVNLAGASTNRLSWKMSLQEFRHIIDSNLTSTFLVTREFIPEMRNQGRGRIVNISSVVAYLGAAGAAHYAAAKAGIVGLTKSLALELASKNICVSAIALGYFRYGLIDSIVPDMQEKIKARIPAQRFGTGEELCALIEYLLSDAGAYAGGQVFHLNGGLYS